MSTEVDRQELLTRLLAIEPALAKREVLQQSSCFVLRQGWAFSLNQELACAVGTGLDPSITGAINAAPLLAILKQFTEERLILASNGKTLNITGKKDNTRIPIDTDVKLPIDKVERPAADAWKPLAAEFADAVSMVQKCTRKRDESFAKECIHVCSDWLEASDNVHMARYACKCPVESSLLVRAKSLKEVIPLGFTKIAVTSRWLHFKNPIGLRMSVRAWTGEEYPELSEVLAVTGRKIALPRGLKDAALRAGIFADLSKYNTRDVIVRFKSGEVSIDGNSVLGQHSATRPSDYTGEPFAFKVPAPLLAGLTEQRGTVEISNIALRVSDGPYTYLTSLEWVG